MSPPTISLTSAWDLGGQWGHGGGRGGDQKGVLLGRQREAREEDARE